MCSPGVCAPLPVGGVAVPSDVSDFPHPLAYFPLSGGSTSSWPLRHYSGFQTNVSWIADPKFGVVAHCKDGAQPILYYYHSDHACWIGCFHVSAKGFI